MHALLRREAEGNERAAPNPKRVYRVMKLNGLLLQRHSGRGEERRHDGKIAVQIRPLGPGRYRFFDDYHEDTTEGFLIVK